MAKFIMLAPFLDKSSVIQWGREEYKHLIDLTITGLNSGLDVVTNWHDIEHQMGPLLDKAAEIKERDEFDAIIIGCFLDPGLLAIRQGTHIPILGPGETSLCVAAMVGHKIGVIVPEKHFLGPTENMIRNYQFTDRVVAVRSVADFIPETIHTKPMESVSKMAETCLQIIQDNDADVVVFGCIGFSWMANQVRELVSKAGFKTPIIEPGLTAYNAAKMLIELGLNQDRRKLNNDALRRI
jgi:allantoin racemase